MVLVCPLKNDMTLPARRIGTGVISLTALCSGRNHDRDDATGIDRCRTACAIKKKLMAQVFRKQRVTILQRLWLLARCGDGIACFFAGYYGCNCLRPKRDLMGRRIVLAAQLGQ